MSFAAGIRQIGDHGHAGLSTSVINIQLSRLPLWLRVATMLIFGKEFVTNNLTLSRMNSLILSYKYNN